MEALTMSRVVARYLLTRGHHLPAPWTAIAAQPVLLALANILSESAIAPGEPMTTAQYESALECLAAGNMLNLSNIATVGPLLQHYCSYLVERGLLESNPHADTQVTFNRPESNHEVLIQEPRPQESLFQAVSVVRGWDWWKECEDSFFTAREAGRRRLEGHTPANYRTDLKLAYAYLSTHHESLCKEAIEQYVRYLETAPLSRGRKPYLLPTVVRKKNTLRTFLRFASQKSHLPAVDLNELLGSKKGDKSAVSPHRALSPESDSAYLVAAGNLQPGEQAMALLPRLCGLRATDAGKLRWNDVDWARSCLDYYCMKVRRRVQVPLPAKMEEALRLYRESSTEQEFLFTKGGGKAANRRDVEDVVHRVARDAGIMRKVTPHDLRVTFATHKHYHEGADIHRLMNWLGHEDVNTTLGYIDGIAGWTIRYQVRRFAA